MPSAANIELLFPVEWADFFEHQDDDDLEEIYGSHFGFDEWGLWVRDHPGWEYMGTNERNIATRNHDTPTFEGMSLSCHRMVFRVYLNQPQSQRHPVRRELRISVPPPTKLPLPR